MAQKLKKGDKVIVIAGRDKGKVGDILKVIPSDGQAIVSGVQLVKRHQKQTAQQEAGIVHKEAVIDLSNLAYLDPKENKPTRVGFKFEDGKKVRYAKLSGEVING